MKILVVDDDRILADVIAFTLRREGYEILLAEDGVEAISRWGKDQPDLIILDINLPKMDGFAVCREIRASSEIPILLLTVRSDEEDIVYGLKQGADDYITKPFSPRQLVARVEAVLRRARLDQPATARQIGRFELDLNRHELTIDQKKTIALTPLEYRLMDFLMIHAGQIVAFEMIIDYVWSPLEGDKDILRQLVHRLRKKVEPELDENDFIENIPGLGYGLILNSSEP